MWACSLVIVIALSFYIVRLTKQELERIKAEQKSDEEAFEEVLTSSEAQQEGYATFAKN